MWEEEFGWKPEVKTAHSTNSGTVREGFLGTVAAFLEGLNTFEAGQAYLCVSWKVTVCILDFDLFVTLCVYQCIIIIIIIITQWFGSR